METIMMPIGDVKPYPNNPRKNKQAIDKVAASIKEFGFQQPIVVDKDYVIIVGHTRLEAAKRLKLEEVPVVVADTLSEEQVKAYRLADNKTNEFSDWDLNKLLDELDDIVNLDMLQFGFDLIERKEVVEDDYSPEIPEEPNAELGQIYKLGRHYLMCGDSTDINDVEKLAQGEKMDMLLTDPPYNVNYEGTAGKIKNDNMESEKFREFLTSAFYNAKSVLKMGGVFHIWYADSEGYNFRGACQDAGLDVRQQLIWVKSQATIGRQDFQHQYESVLSGDSWLAEEEMIANGFEPMLYGWKDGTGHKWFKKRKERDVLFFDKPRASAEHPTMKPILLFDYEMKCNTKPGEKVMDLFGGSGTTIMAAEQNDRTAYVMEYDPKFVDVIIDRWEKFTGKKAELLK